jgi:hypothetical protein
MAGAKTNNNQLKTACRHGHAAAKLLPPSVAAAAKLPATAELPLVLLRCHCLPPWKCCCQAASTAAALPPSCRRRCQAARHSQAAATAAVLPLPPPWLRCCQAAAAMLPPLLPSCLPPQSCCCRCCAAAAAAALPPRFPKHCRHLQNCTSAKLPPPPPSWPPPRRHRPAATAKATLPSTTPSPLFSLSLLLLSLSPFPSLLPTLFLVDCCCFLPPPLLLMARLSIQCCLGILLTQKVSDVLLRNDVYIYIVSNAYIRYFALLRNGIINNYVLSGNIYIYFLCCSAMYDLSDKSVAD